MSKLIPTKLFHRLKYLFRISQFSSAWFAINACRAADFWFPRTFCNFFAISVPCEHFFALFVHFLFLVRILLRSVVYAGSNHRLGLAGEFGQICAGIYQCAIQRGSAGMELGKVLEPQLDLTNSVRLKSDSSALPCHHCTILRATTYMPRIRHVVIINFLKVEIPRPKLNLAKAANRGKVHFNDWNSEQ